jgi:hypothetical protein
MPSGVIRLRNSKKNQPNKHEVVPLVDNSGVHPVEYRDDSVLRKDVHPNTWAPEGQNPNAPYPVVKGQGYHRTMAIVGPRAKEPIYAPDKYRPFGSSKKSARQWSIDTDQVTGVHFQSPPVAAEMVDHEKEGPVRGRQSDKSSKGKQ